MKRRTRKKRVRRNWRKVRQLIVRALGRHDRWSILVKMEKPEMRPILKAVVYGAIAGGWGWGVLGGALRPQEWRVNTRTFLAIGEL